MIHQIVDAANSLFCVTIRRQFLPVCLEGEDTGPSVTVHGHLMDPDGMLLVPVQKPLVIYDIPLAVRFKGRLAAGSHVSGLQRRQRVVPHQLCAVVLEMIEIVIDPQCMS